MKRLRRARYLAGAGTSSGGRKAELERLLADVEEPPPLLHPEMATCYRDKVATLHEALQDDSEATRLKAGEVLRSLVKDRLLKVFGLMVGLRSQRASFEARVRELAHTTR